MTEKKTAPSFQFMKDESTSVLGGEWVPMYCTDEPVEFSKGDFETAMLNVIREPNINSTAILRADILAEKFYDLEGNEQELSTDDKPVLSESLPYDADAKLVNIDDITTRKELIENKELELTIVKEFVRRMIPRNPYKDALINQTCLVYNSKRQRIRILHLCYTFHILKMKQIVHSIYLMFKSGNPSAWRYTIGALHTIPRPE